MNNFSQARVGSELGHHHRRFWPRPGISSHDGGQNYCRYPAYDKLLTAMQNLFLKLLFVALVLPVAALAQNPTKWSLELEPKPAVLKAGERILLNLKAEIEPGWHLYALDQPEGGPIATTIVVTD